MARYIFFFALFFSVSAWADDLRPASLSIISDTPQQFSVVWKVPIKNKVKPDFSIEFDAETSAISPVRSGPDGAMWLETWKVKRVSGIAGMYIHVAGLEGSSYEVIVRIPTDDGRTLTQVLNTERTSLIVPDPEGVQFEDVFTAYLFLGFEHILIGIDHLLFVLALILLVTGWKKLVWTITFFTLAHSLTLIGVTMDWFYLPGPPVESAIALSIVFLARELVTVHRGGESLTAKYPWVVAFTFGLLHGMGFAGALSDIGVPQDEVLLALLAFNVGVELGQLTFVAVVLALGGVISKLISNPPSWLRLTPTYAIGIMASFWVIQRVMQF